MHFEISFSMSSKIVPKPPWNLLVSWVYACVMFHSQSHHKTAAMQLRHTEHLSSQSSGDSIWPIAMQMDNSKLKWMKSMSLLGAVHQSANCIISLLAGYWWFCPQVLKFTNSFAWRRLPVNRFWFVTVGMWWLSLLQAHVVSEGY